MSNRNMDDERESTAPTADAPEVTPLDTDPSTEPLAPNDAEAAPEDFDSDGTTVTTVFGEDFEGDENGNVRLQVVAPFFYTSFETRDSEGSTLVVTREGTEVPAGDAESLIEQAAERGVTLRSM